MMNSLPLLKEPSATIIKFISFVSTAIIFLAAILIVLAVLSSVDPSSVANDPYIYQSMLKVYIMAVICLIFFGLIVRDFRKWKYIIGNIFFGVGLILILLYLIASLRYFTNMSILTDVFRIEQVIVAIIFVIIGIIFYSISVRQVQNLTENVAYTEIPIIDESLVGRRIMAEFIDYFFLGCIFFFGTYIWGDSVKSNDARVLRVIHPSDIVMIMTILIWIAYFPLMEAFTGQTIGKALLSLQVVRENPHYHPLRVAILRRAFDLFELFSLGIISIGLIKFTKHHKRIGDYIGGSRVIRREIRKDK